MSTVKAQVQIHKDDEEHIRWALAHGWHFLMSPQGIPLITKPNFYVAFAVDPRLTDAGRATIGKEMADQPAEVRP